MGLISVGDAVEPLTLCVWTIDVRLEINLAKDYLDLNVTVGGNDTQQIGRCAVNSYNLGVSETTPDLSAVQPSTTILESLLSSQRSIRKSLPSNFLLISYWTPDNNQQNAGLSISWAVSSPSPEANDNVTNIATTVSVAIGSVICFACCLVGIYKLSKVWRRRRIYLDRTELGLIYQGNVPSRRLYSHYSAPILRTLYLMEGNYELVMPKTLFRPALLEVGHAVCSICMEE